MKHARIPAVLSVILTLTACEKKSAETKPHFQSFPPPPAANNPTPGTQNNSTVAIPVPPEQTPPPASGDEKIPVTPAAPGDNFATEANRILQLPNGPVRDSDLRSFVVGTMHQDFLKTEDWIVKLPPSPTRDKAYAAFIDDLANVAPNNALGYVSRISDPKLRSQLEAKIQQAPNLLKPPEQPELQPDPPVPPGGK